MKILVIVYSLILTTWAYLYFDWRADPFLVELLGNLMWVSLCALLYAELQCERRYKRHRKMFKLLRQEYVRGAWTDELQRYSEFLKADVDNPPWYVRWGGR